MVSKGQVHKVYDRFIVGLDLALKISNLLNLQQEDLISNILSRKGNKAITRQMARIMIKEVAQTVGVVEEINTYSFNHSNLSVKKRYLGVTQSDVNDLYENHLI